MSFGAAERDHLALELLEALDGGLRQQRIGRRLHLDAHDRDRRAHPDGAHRVDQAGRHADIERAGGDLLHQLRARLHINDVDLQVLGGEEPLVEADEDRPEIGRGLCPRFRRSRSCAACAAGAVARSRSARPSSTFDDRACHNPAPFQWIYSLMKPLSARDSVARSRCRSPSRPAHARRYRRAPRRRRRSGAARR